MSTVTHATYVSGFDVGQVTLPPGAELLQPPLPLPAMDDFQDACARALEEPLDGPPLSARLKRGTRVCVLVDDFTLPLPLAARDARRDMLEAVLDALAQAGVRPAQVKVLVATGPSRHWRPAELAELLGPRATALAAVRCHDLLDTARLARLGEVDGAPLELARDQVEADLCVHLSVVCAPWQASAVGLVAGSAGLATFRALHAPALFAHDGPTLAPGSPWQRALVAAAAAYEAKVPVLQLCCVLDNALWGPRLAQVLERNGGFGRPMQLWNALPNAVRHRAARLMRAEHRPLGVFAGSTFSTAPAALELFLRQHEVAARGEADVLAFGLPDLGPASVGTAQNPLLAAHLALGLAGQLASRGPLLRKGGVVVFANPLFPDFDVRTHRPHLELYERVLREAREPEDIERRFAQRLCDDAGFQDNYRRHFGFHPAHALAGWYQGAPLRRRAAKVLVAHGDPRACARLGFTAARDMADALERARLLVGGVARVRFLALPPAFFARVD